MKRLLAILLTLCLFAACALAEEGERLRYGYIAPYQGETGRSALTAAAFAYAAQRKGVETVVVHYEPAGQADAPSETPSPAADPAGQALDRMLADDVDGVVVVPETLEQAVALIERANEAGVPIVIEGMDLSAAYPPPPVPDEVQDLPFVAAVCYGDAASYAAANWLEANAQSPLVLHCELPNADPAIRAGLRRALSEASYLALADEIAAGENTPDAGYDVVTAMFNSYNLFYCILVDSAALAVGCVGALREVGESMPIAVIDNSPEAMDLLMGGAIDMLASTPASLEGVCSFKALDEYVNSGAIPGGDFRLALLPAVVATAKDASGWFSGDDYEAAYRFAYPEDAPAEAAQ